VDFHLCPNICLSGLCFNLRSRFRVSSNVDLMKFDGVTSVRLHSSRRDITSRGSSFFVRWTEVFFLSHSGDLEPADQMATASLLAKAICVTLSPSLERLWKANMKTIAIRINLDVEKVSCRLPNCR
jgi:hypothetical protein